MLRLNVIVHNPVAASAMAWADMIILALLGAIVVGLWVVVVRGRARRDVRDFDDSASDNGLQTLRRRRLVVLRSRKPRGQPGAVVAELEATSESQPTGLTRSR